MFFFVKFNSIILILKRFYSLTFHLNQLKEIRLFRKLELLIVISYISNIDRGYMVGGGNEVV